MKDDRIYLQHILQNLRKIEASLLGFDKDKFLNEEDTQDAIIRRLELVGEAAKRISPELRRVSPPFRGAPSRGCATNSFTIISTWIWMKFGKRLR